MGSPERVGIILRRLVWWDNGPVSSVGEVWWWPATEDGQVPDYPPVHIGTMEQDGLSEDDHGHDEAAPPSRS